MIVDTGELPEAAESVVSGSWWALFAGFGETMVMDVDLRASQDREAEAWASLDHAERVRWSELRYPGPRRRFALCRAALRAILAEQLGCPSDRLAFVAADRGKPFCLVGGEPAAISFNVSHSGSHGLIAFAPGGDVGVDVEERLERPYLDGLIDTVLTREEQSQIRGLHHDLRLYSFFRFWTIKEAIVKAAGVGHGLDVSRIATPTPMCRGARAAVYRSPLLPGKTLQLQDIGNEDFAAALAYEILP